MRERKGIKRIGGKRGGFYSEDVLNLKYLPKFKWENLTEKINYDLKMRKEKMRNELALAKKQHDFYLEQVEKGKKIMGIKKSKVRKEENGLIYSL
ncbi:MAG TPA: hypothetical protein PLS50_08630 [Candidatus Dojkabacteria bacterium]|nr:hypothetical protein [Candidatus Dojkabacteria bacterium]